MRFYTKQHPYYCGIDLHARTMYLCVLNQQDEIVLHRNMPCSADSLVKAIAPYRQDVVIAVEYIFPCLRADTQTGMVVLLPYRYPDVADRGIGSAPLPNPESNWTAPQGAEPSF